MSNDDTTAQQHLSRVCLAATFVTTHGNFHHHLNGSKLSCLYSLHIVQGPGLDKTLLGYVQVI